MALKARMPIKYTSVQSITSVGYSGWVSMYYKLPQTVAMLVQQPPFISSQLVSTNNPIGKGVARYPQKSGPVHAPDHGLSPTGSIDN